MDSLDIEYLITGEIMPGITPGQTIIIETEEPVISKFENKKRTTIHSYNTSFISGDDLYLNKRKNARKGFRVSSLFNYGTKFKTAYLKVPKSKASSKMTYQDVLNRRYDAQTWKGLSIKEMSYNAPSTPKVKYINSYFTKEELAEIKAAFENKTNIRIEKKGTRRDITVSTTWLPKEQIFKASFQSEFSGTANGDYYLLMNPTLAVFYESD